MLLWSAPLNDGFGGSAVDALPPGGLGGHVMRKVWAFCGTVLVLAFTFRVAVNATEQTWCDVQPVMPFVIPALVVVVVAGFWYRQKSRW